MATQFTILKTFGKLIKRFLISITAGLLVSSSFSDAHWYYAIFGLALLVHLLDQSTRKQRVLVVGIFTAVYFASQLYWLRVIGSDAWLLVVLISVLPWLMLALLKVNKKRLTSLIAFAAFVVVIETVRSHLPFGGFPWSLIAYSQVDGPLVNFAAIGGQALVTFLVVLISGLISGLIFTKPVRTFLVLSFLIFWANLLQHNSVKLMTSLEVIPVTAIQGNVPRLGFDLDTQRMTVFQNHVKVTNKYLETLSPIDKPVLILWPESSTDIDPLTSGVVATEIDRLVDRSGVPILVGATTWGINPTGPRNAGILWNVDNTKDFYFKNHLVPFGEYIPFRDFLANHIDRLALIPNDFIPGKQLGLFKISDLKFGSVICFEIAYGDYIRHLVNDGQSS